MKHLDIQIRLRAEQPGAEDWCLSVRIAEDALDGVIREAAGIDGGKEWRYVELYVQSAVRDALLSWAEKVCPQVERIRAQRDLMMAAMGRDDTPPDVHWQRLENFARREIKPRSEEMLEAFASFIYRHYGGYWVRPGAEHERTRLGLPSRVVERVAEMARKDKP